MQYYAACSTLQHMLNFAARHSKSFCLNSQQLHVFLPPRPGSTITETQFAAIWFFTNHSQFSSSLNTPRLKLQTSSPGIYLARIHSQKGHPEPQTLRCHQQCNIYSSRPTTTTISRESLIAAPLQHISTYYIGLETNFQVS